MYHLTIPTKLLPQESFNPVARARAHTHTHTHAHTPPVANCCCALLFVLGVGGIDSLLETEASSRLGILLGSTLPLTTPPVPGARGRQIYSEETYMYTCSSTMYALFVYNVRNILTTFMCMVGKIFLLNLQTNLDKNPHFSRF